MNPFSLAVLRLLALLPHCVEIVLEIRRLGNKKHLEDFKTEYFRYKPCMGTSVPQQLFGYMTIIGVYVPS